ncbi:hypothetical protein [Pseudomonas phage SRT6]|nr:hypothetical protein [Pseudomonas phage SRT6]
MYFRRGASREILTFRGNQRGCFLPVLTSIRHSRVYCNLNIAGRSLARAHNLFHFAKNTVLGGEFTSRFAVFYLDAHAIQQLLALHGATEIDGAVFSRHDNILGRRALVGQRSNPDYKTYCCESQSDNDNQSLHNLFHIHQNTS